MVGEIIPKWPLLRTDWMQALPDLNFDNFSAWAEDTELSELPVKERQRRADLQRRSICAKNGN